MIYISLKYLRVFVISMKVSKNDLDLFNRNIPFKDRVIYQQVKFDQTSLHFFDTKKFEFNESVILTKKFNM